MNNEEIAERLIKVEERAKSNTNQINDMKTVVSEIHTMSMTMVQLVEEIKHTNENVSSLNDKVEKMDERVDKMEKEPLDDIKYYKRQGLSKAISVIVGALTIGLILLISQCI